MALPDDSDTRNLAELIPIIQPNIVLAFSSELTGSGDYTDDKENKYLHMEINERMKFRIRPSQPREIDSANYLKCDPNFNAQIKNFTEVIRRYIDKNMVIGIQVPQGAQPLNVSEFVQFLFYDLESCLSTLFI